MGLETGTYIDDLNINNPVSGDLKSAGDNHLRLIKEVLKNTFPNATKPFLFPSAKTGAPPTNIPTSGAGSTYVINTSAGDVPIVLPTLVAADAGWECSFLKTSSDGNAIFISPASGVLRSGEIAGLAKCRRGIPGFKSSAFWTGTEWIVSRVLGSPIGSVLAFCGAGLPVGYVWPNGQTLNTTAFPDFAAVVPSGITPDHRGRVDAGKDDMGGTSANRLTNPANTVGGLDGDVLGGVGGEEVHVLTKPQLPSGNLAVTLTDPGHYHPFSATLRTGDNPAVLGGGQPTGRGAEASNTGGPLKLSDNTPGTGITVSVALGGSDFAHNVVQPTIVQNKILVVE